MMAALTVSVGLVTWNSAAFLEDCLQSLRGQEDVAFELVVVDNGSGDDSPGIVQRYFPGAVVQKNEDNLGFCGGHNQAIRLSHGDVYLALNPDIVLQPGYLRAAVEVLRENPRVGLVATKLKLGTPGQNENRIDSTGLFIDRRRRQYLRGFGEVDCGQYDQPGPVFGVDGAAPLYRRAMLEDIQVEGEYFDEMFFVHKEDVDLCWRARLRGWTCHYTPEAVAYHRRSFQPGRRERLSPFVRYHAVKNRYLLLLKNESRVTWQRDWPGILWYDLKILAYLMLFERTSLKALHFTRANWKKIQARRAEIWRRVNVSDLEIQSWFV